MQKTSFKQKAVMLILLMFVCALIFGCAKGLTKEYKTVIFELCQTSGETEPVDITGQVMTTERKEKFSAVKQVLTLENNYIFICRPYGYYKTIDFVVVIDGKTNLTRGIRVISHHESVDYVRSMLTDTRFTDRFAQKSAEKYLQLAKLEVAADNDVVQITGATVTTQTMLNGINAAFGVYCEYVLGQQAEAVPEKVSGYIQYVH